MSVILGKLRISNIYKEAEVPHVFVQHTTFPGEDLTRLFYRFPDEVLGDVAGLLAVESWPLAPDDFSLTFRKKDSCEMLTAHFQILIFAHAFPERVKKQDEISEKIAQAVAKWAENFPWEYQREPITISVSLILSEIGYKTAVVQFDSIG